MDRARLIRRRVEQCEGIINKWAGKFPSHRDDFKSEARLGVLITLEKYGDEAPIELVRTIVGRQLSTLVSYIPVVRVPKSTAYRQAEDRMVQTVELHCHHCSTAHRINLDDVVDTIALTDREKEVVYHRLNGATQQQIADKLEVSQTTVHNIIKRLKERYYETK